MIRCVPGLVARGEGIQLIPIIVGNKKGGVGKTTISILLSRYLAAARKRVLAMDFDSQQSLTYLLTAGIDIRESSEDLDLTPEAFAELSETISRHTIAELFNANAPPAKDLVVQTTLTSRDLIIDLIPTDGQLDDVQIQEKKLMRILQSVSDDYDFVIIDSPPSKDERAANLHKAVRNLGGASIVPMFLQTADLVATKLFVDGITDHNLWEIEDSLDHFTIFLNKLSYTQMDQMDDATTKAGRIYEKFQRDGLGPYEGGRIIKSDSLALAVVEEDELISTARSKQRFYDSLTAGFDLVLEKLGARLAEPPAQF